MTDGDKMIRALKNVFNQKISANKLIIRKQVSSNEAKTMLNLLGEGMKAKYEKQKIMVDKRIVEEEARKK